MLPLVKNFASFNNWIDEFFGKDLLPDFSANTGVSMPAVNIKETADSFEIEVAAPGLEKKDFAIDLENNLLTISAEKETKHEESDKKIMRREFSYSSFKRSFNLPSYANNEQISAIHENGILKIVVKKKDEAISKPAKKIEIS